MSDELGIRFDIDKLGGGAYGLESWRVIWSTIEPAVIGPATLREGDTMATLSGQENVFCVAVASGRPGGADALRAALETSPAYQRVAASPPFTDPAALLSEPLVDAGIVDASGKVEGMWAGAGLTAVQDERAATAVTAPPGPGASAPPGTVLTVPAPPAPAPPPSTTIATPPGPGSWPGGTPVAPRPERRVPLVVVGVLALVGAVAGYFVTAAVAGDESTSSVEAGDLASDGADDEAEVESTPGEESPESRDETPDGDVPPSARPDGIAVVESSAGPLPVLSITKTDEYPAGCTVSDDFGCTTSDFGARIVVITLGPAPGLSAQETNARLEGESFSENEALEATIEESGFPPLEAFTLLTSGDTIELAYAFLFSEDSPSVVFTWPGNPPVELVF